MKLKIQKQKLKTVYGYFRGVLANYFTQLVHISLVKKNKINPFISY